MSKGDVEIDIVSSVGVEKDDVRSVVCSGVPVSWLPAMMDTQPATHETTQAHHLFYKSTNGNRYHQCQHHSYRSLSNWREIWANPKRRKDAKRNSHKLSANASDVGIAFNQAPAPFPFDERRRAASLAVGKLSNRF